MNILKVSKKVVLFFLLSPILVSCGDDEPIEKKQTQISDAYLFQKIGESGFSFYKDNSDTLSKLPNVWSHNPYMRVRFNSVAKAALTDNGKLPKGGVFPDSSLIVKELYNTKGGPLLLYAVMYKAPKDSSAGEGWVWSEYKPDGKVVVSLTQKGNQCISCHKTSANRDLIRLFDLIE